MGFICNFVQNMGFLGIHAEKICGFADGSFKDE